VDSVLAQEGVDVRVLIIDDCSPDTTPEVAAELLRQDRRVEYRRHEVNRGHIETYNEGLFEWASSDYCLLLSADDLLAAGALRRAIDVFASQPRVGLVHGRQVTFDQEPPQLNESYVSRSVNVLDGHAFIEHCCEIAGNPVATPTAVVRTSLQMEVGGYRRHLPHSADMEMWLRCASRAAVARVEAVQAFKRMHNANMQQAYLATHLGDLKQREATFDSFFSTDGSRLRDSYRLRTLAGKRLANEAFCTASRALDLADTEAASRCLEFALRLDPDLKSSRDWNRLRLKRRFGPVWKLIRPIVDRLRGHRLIKVS
jgi:glycosyltransferase involved in cell wall biosynthesis